jgi:uncharacterized protein YdcH (DUF465 family)
MSYLSDPPPHHALREDTPIGHWPDRVDHIIRRQKSRLMQISGLDRRIARLATNRPNRLWRRMARLGDRIEAVLDDHRTGAERLSRLHSEGLHLKDEAVLRAEYDRLGLLLARIAQIETHALALQARIDSRRMAGAMRRDLRVALSAHKARLTDTSRALRLLHVEVSAHLVEFR